VHGAREVLETTAIPDVVLFIGDLEKTKLPYAGEQ
jgi:hypothetical protein